MATDMYSFYFFFSKIFNRKQLDTHEVIQISDYAFKHIITTQ